MDKKILLMFVTVAVLCGLHHVNSQLGGGRLRGVFRNFGGNARGTRGRNRGANRAVNRIANPGRGRAANLRGNRGGNRFGNRGQSARCTTRQRRQGLCGNQRTTAAPRPVQTPAPETGLLGEVRRSLRNFINDNRERIANYLQLVFHSCIGGCDGCVNLNEDHNRALKQPFQELHVIWRNAPRWHDIMSFADFIVLAGAIATEEGFRNHRDAPGFHSIRFRTGRTGCPDPNNYNIVHGFPKGENDDAIQQLQREFGVTTRQAIALMGAHSVGRCRPENMGFTGPWDRSEFVFDNHYYQSMAGGGFNLETQPNGLPQWTHPGGFMMLIADMALLRNTGRSPSCRVSDRCSRASTASIVEQYANNDQVWAREFVSGFEKMVAKGLPPN